MGKRNVKKFINVIFDDQEEKFVKAAVDVNFLEFVERGTAHQGAKEVYMKLKPLSYYPKANLNYNVKTIVFKWQRYTEYYKEKILKEIERRAALEVCIK